MYWKGDVYWKESVYWREAFITYLYDLRRRLLERGGRLLERGRLLEGRRLMERRLLDSWHLLESIRYRNKLGNQLASLVDIIRSVRMLSVCKF